MAQITREFVRRFVVPLLGGGEVEVGRPLRLRDRDGMLIEATSTLLDPELQYHRLRRAQEVTPHPLIPDPDDEELSLWAGLHNALVFDHPERARVWSRASTWRRVEGATRILLSLPFPAEPWAALARHVSVGAFMELLRTDIVMPTAAGEVRYLGQDVPRRRRRLAAVASGGREETVRWLGQPHAPETHRLIEDVMRASPLSCLLHPLMAPAGWSPLWAAPCLRERAFTRAICHRWARHKDWIGVGGAVMGALAPSLPNPRAASMGASRTDGRIRVRDESQLVHAAGGGHRGGQLALPGAVLPRDPVTLAAIYGCLVHLHFLKVLELDTRLGVALSSRDPGILGFLALPLLLPSLGEVTGTPLGGLAGPVGPRGFGGARGLGGTDPFEVATARRWTEYVDHLQELVPRSVVENLLATLVPAIVKPT